MSFRLLVTILLLTPAALLATEAITSKVARVIDGDTVVLATGAKVRLADIDAPESNQPHGKVATTALSDMILGKTVTVTFSKKDRYRRIIGTITLNDVSINERMLTLGHAWWYRKYSKSKHYATLDTKARTGRAGLWRNTSPLPPWTFRKSR